ncbi:MAG: hypothetical protein LBH01_11570 [Verrucomicrobiales bacterium]|jgi:hypothetical protein|nr:hypothetical protein [Verrucomicrobiales bacterium]
MRVDDIAAAGLRLLPIKRRTLVQIRNRRDLKGAFFGIKKAVTFNEKIEWIKANYRKPLMVRCADKYLAREYVGSLLPETYLVPLYGVYRRAEEINYDQLPEQFALKVNHGSGWNIFCRSKSQLDRRQANAQLNGWLDQSWYNHRNREWVYKDIPRRIVCEKYFIPGEGGWPLNYKVHCFHGVARYVELGSNNQSEVYSRNIYDRDWNLQPFRWNYPNLHFAVERPSHLEELLRISERLAAPFPYVRADFFIEDGQIYFNELTFYPSNALSRFYPEKYDALVGGHLDLDRVRCELSRGL